MCSAVVKSPYCSARRIDLPVGQPGDHECRVSADAVYRQGCRRDPAESARRRHGRRYAVGDATTGPSDSDGGKDGGSPARAVHRQNCGHACDRADHPGDQACQNPASGEAATANGVGGCGSPAGAVRRDSCGSASDHADYGVDATTGLSDPRCVEDCGNPAGAVRRDSGGAACDHADHPEVVETTPQERAWCIFEDGGYDTTSLPQPDGVAGALAWLTSRPARVDQPPVQHTKRRRNGDDVLYPSRARR